MKASQLFPWLFSDNPLISGSPSSSSVVFLSSHVAFCFPQPVTHYGGGLWLLLTLVHRTYFLFLLVVLQECISCLLGRAQSLSNMTTQHAIQPLTPTSTLARHCEKPVCGHESHSFQWLKGFIELNSWHNTLTLDTEFLIHSILKYFKRLRRSIVCLWVRW